MVGVLNQRDSVERHIEDRDGQLVSLDTLNERAQAWHEQYGERGEFWPEGRPAQRSGACNAYKHELCTGARTVDGVRYATPCECGCHE